MKIFLSPEAEAQLDNLLFYLENVWGERVMFNFIDKFEQALMLIQKMPLAYPVSDKMPGLHRCVITRQTSLYYQVGIDNIEVVAVLDNRQELTN